MIAPVPQVSGRVAGAQRQAEVEAEFNAPGLPNHFHLEHGATRVQFGLIWFGCVSEKKRAERRGGEKKGKKDRKKKKKDSHGVEVSRSSPVRRRTELHFWRVLLESSGASSRCHEVKAGDAPDKTPVHNRLHPQTDQWKL